jgi:myo-inositol-1(or 4)-monophosphatase
VQYEADLLRIEEALDRAVAALIPHAPGQVEARTKQGDDPVTGADLEVDTLLRETLPLPGEGWLSEETADDLTRLRCSRVWVVDPIDGTREFVAGIPEWCVSIGLVVDGKPVAGGIHNPATGERFIGASGLGVTYRGTRPVRRPVSLAGAEILASRSEVKRGEWRRFSDAGLQVKPMGSVAYKLALVAAARADATWTLVPKNEWDVAAGAALVGAGGGVFGLPGGGSRSFNARDPWLHGFFATRQEIQSEIEAELTLPASAASP